MMFNRVNFYRISIVGLLSLIGISTGVNAEIQVGDLEDYEILCESSADYNVEFEFSPEGNRFLGKTISLFTDKATPIKMVLQLNRSDSDIGESYLWAVVASPALPGFRFGGELIDKKAQGKRLVDRYKALSPKRDSLNKMATLSRFNDQPVHTTIKSRKIDKSESLNNAWINVFGNKIIDLVYKGTRDKKSREKRAYTLTFYYVHTPTLKIINSNGYHWPLLKHVGRAGKIFGFVLTPNGDCLESVSVEMVKN